eukprot:scaffold212933_cov22-Tisochrysis_lutea.AAC.1
MDNSNKYGAPWLVWQARHQEQGAGKAWILEWTGCAGGSQRDQKGTRWTHPSASSGRGPALCCRAA